MRVDLHIHTTASDGTSTPQQVVQKARDYGLKAIAITDHDEVSGIPLAQIEGESLGVEVIPGIEINTEFEKREVHVLGYFIDYNHAGLQQKLTELKNARLIRIEKIIKRLHNLGIMVDFNRVKELAGDGSIGRPHIGMALIEKGYIGSVQEAFNRFIGYGKPAYVPRDKIDPLEAVEIIRAAKGVAVLAHPGLAERDHLIPLLAKKELQGLEVYYPEHNPEMVKKYLALAQRLALVATGGSDYHGSELVYRADLGEVTVAYQVVEDLRRRCPVQKG